MALTVLVAAAEHLPDLLDRIDMDGAASFSDSDALKALETITRQKPDVVALDRVFASTSRGAALINRIKSDPALASCEIRVLAHDGTHARGSHRVVESTPHEPTSPETLGAPLDPRGTRRAPRFAVADDVEVLVDGNPATLLTVSLVGALVVSASILKPNQRVRLWLHDPVRPIRFNASVAWASFEIPKTGPRYRAGIEFLDAAVDVLRRFIDTNKRE